MKLSCCLILVAFVQATLKGCFISLRGRPGVAEERLTISTMTAMTRSDMAEETTPPLGSLPELVMLSSSARARSSKQEMPREHQAVMKHKLLYIE